MRTEPEWVRKARFAARLGAWEEMLRWYLPAYHKGEVGKLFEGDKWQRFMPPAYWEWLNAEGNHDKWAEINERILEEVRRGKKRKGTR